MQRKWLTAMVAAGTLAFGGAAFAQTSPSSPSGGAEHNTMSPSTPGSSGMGGAGTESGGATMGAKPATPPQSIVGKDVVNSNGDTIGEIQSVQGDQVIVSVGGFLGIGSRDVALDWNQLTTTGTGDDVKIQTSMTKDQLKSLPEYKSGSNSSNPSPSDAGSPSSTH